jgi:DNA helicase-2/ATP-dependent DNA helicase PcrA
MDDGSGRYVLRDLRARRAQGFRIDYEGELNPAQLAAVTTLDGPLLVIAGAGTGKTRTLVYRVARLVESGIDPTQLLLLTFTRRAAQEMLRRAGLLLDGRCERVTGGTFHSYANAVLRREGTAIGLHQSFTILDRGDTEDVINLLRAQHGLDRKERLFPRKQVIAEMLSMSVNKGLPLAQLIDAEYSHLAEHTDALLLLAREYAAYKRERQLVDYDDLLVLLCTLLREHDERRRRLSSKARYIMVDEYQDTNSLQAEIVRLLASEHHNVMAVGDDAQSIYSFRGANFRNIMDFPSLFPGTRIIAIEENYRSTQPILDLTNAIIERAGEGYEKHLFSARKTGAPPMLIAAPTEHLQSRFVCQRILELREEGVPLPEIAVLFRSSFHAFDLEIELARHDIPFVKRGGFKFVESAHIKDLLAHVRVIANPSDAVSWHRILLLLDGIGPKASEEIIRAVLSSSDPVQCLRDARSRGGASLHALANLLERVRGIDLPAAQLEEVLRYYEPILKRVHRDDHPKRRKDLDQLLTIAARFGSLEALLVEMALEPPAEAVDDTLAGEPVEDRLILSTIHSAKGLEWHSVFILWAAEGRFPSAYNVADEDIEEERRLMYVAATRAKEQLYLTYPIHIFDRGYGMVLGKASRFIDGLAPQLLRPVTLVDEMDAPRA